VSRTAIVVVLVSELATPPSICHLIVS